MATTKTWEIRISRFGDDHHAVVIHLHSLFVAVDKSTIGIFSVRIILKTSQK
jgi:hypothetical protein